MTIKCPVTPAGWRILVEPVKIKTHTDGGLELPQETIRAQEHLRYVGTVVAMGELCFKADNFKPHPNAKPVGFCAVGDMVAFGKFAGQEIITSVDGETKRYRLINDDEVLARIEDPSSIVIPF